MRWIVVSDGFSKLTENAAWGVILSVWLTQDGDSENDRGLCEIKEKGEEGRGKDSIKKERNKAVTNVGA